MPATIKVKKGLDIKLLGKAKKNIQEISSHCFAIKPIDFCGVFPKLLIKEDDNVKAGTPLYFDKYRQDILFTSPVSGKVKEIRRGAKRVLLEIVIDAGKEQEYEDFGNADPKTLNREQIVEKMLKSGVWPVIRQRPYGIIANPADDPKAIFISAFDTHPLAPDFNFIVDQYAGEFQEGVDALIKLTSGKVYLNISNKANTSKVFLETRGVQINKFSGPHPAGNVGTQINKLDPVNIGEVVWYLRPQEVITIGRLFKTGKLDSTRIIALTGSEVKNPVYYKTLIGASISEMVKDNVSSARLRYISGNVLTGRKIEKDGFVGFYDSQVTVIPEGDYYEFFGWATPGFNKYSYYNQFFAPLRPNKKYRLDTNLHGGERAFVVTGKFEKVFPLNIYPMQLIKAIIIEDIDLMENLGIYEVDEEDFALCEFIDTSKTEIQTIVRKGLDLMRKEMM
jgi:Na+-transporting NADH:ubiquinone oxidoreductase subunit A